MKTKTINYYEQENYSVKPLTKAIRGIEGIRAIQKNVWSKRVRAFNMGVSSAMGSSLESRYKAGLALYFAEGTKRNNLDITNSNPAIISFMVNWYREFFYIREESLVIQLHLHSGQDEEIMRQYWSELTGIPLGNFQKTFVKPSKAGSRKRSLYHGTVKLRVKGIGSKYILFQILGSIAGWLHEDLGIPPEVSDWIDKPKYV